MDFDPVLEKRRKDFCQFKRCRNYSDIIFKGKGYCDTHFPDILGVQAQDNRMHDPQECGCWDCIPEGPKVEDVVDSIKEAQVSQEEVVPELRYASIEAYSKETGKRFRMTKRQKELGMTREQAFTLTFTEN